MSKELTVSMIQSNIISLPGRPPFMLAQTLAEIYEVTVKRVNQAVKRNPKRFPDDFYFQLSQEEADKIKSQLGTEFWSQSVTKIYAGDEKLLGVFTREGANQLSTVLHSAIAIDRSIQIIRAFSKMEEMANAEMERRARAIKRQGEREWQETRYITKEQRKELTNTIRDILIPHARSQGSTAHEAKIYLSYSKMIKSRLFSDPRELPKDYREQLSIRQLNILAVAESLADGVIQEEAGKGTPYKGPDGIFEKVKAKIIQYAETVGVLRLGEPERLSLARRTSGQLEA